MTSYISSIKNWFKAGYEGRHLELFLLEIARLKPQVLANYLAKTLEIDARRFINAQFQIEYAFKGEKSNRRADMAVTEEGATEPFILIEIKYLDKPLPENENRADQLSDYLRWKRNSRLGDRHVLVLSRELYDKKGLTVKRWDDLARFLRGPAEKSDLIKVLVDYLEEEGIVMQNVQSKSLQRYFTRLVCHTRNVGRAADNLNGPIEFAKVLKNLQMLTGAFTPQFKKAWSEAGEEITGVSSRSKVATIDFLVRNFLHINGKRITEDDDVELLSDAKNGGIIDVFATHSLGHNDQWMRIDYGIEFHVPASTDDGDHSTILYAAARGRQFDYIYRSQSVAYSIVTDKAEAYVNRVEGYFQKMLLETIGALIENKSALDARQVKALKLLKKSLSSDKAADLAEAP